MLRNTTLIALVLPYLFACGTGDSGPTEPDEPEDSGEMVVMVEVSPDTTDVAAIDDTVQFEAEARDENGNTVSEVSFSWNSTEPSVATVDGGGTATARENGATIIEATADGITGRAKLLIRAGELAWAQIYSAGDSCGLTTHGTVYCWGRNAHSQLGVDTDELPSTDTPVLMESASNLYLEDVGIGGGHICVVAFIRTAYCLGAGTFGERGDGETSRGHVEPAEVKGDHEFRQVSAGTGHSCGVTTDDVGYCWGHNDRGELGDGTTTSRHTPVAVAGGLSFEQIIGGGNQRGGLTCGLTPTGAAYCWGANDHGQVGDGTTTDRKEPVPVADDLTFQDLAVGDFHACGLTADGDAFCWGLNESGSVGDGTTSERHEPVPVEGGLTFSSISAGNGYTCALTPNGTAYCWGNNSKGSLGDGTFTHRQTPVQVTGGHTFAQLAAGNRNRTTCAIAEDGTAYCWGSNWSGQLGIGAARDKNEPQPLPEPEGID